MIEVEVVGVGVRADGLDGWQAARPVLAGTAPFVPAPAPLLAPTMLAANERRRIGPVIRLALAVAQEAAESSGLPPTALRAVFASANGDGATVHAILESLASPGQQVSPTQFHNSVHNAAAGYWSIGTGSTEPVTCLGCHDATSAAALLTAAAEAQAERRPVLLCVYDLPFPEPLNTARPTAGIFGAGLVLVPGSGAGPQPEGAAVPGGAKASAPLAKLVIDWRAGPPPPSRAAPCPDFDALARSNPAARLLRLLQALAADRPDRLVLDLLDGYVNIVVQPCSTTPPSSP